jgi:hypothetical protein
MLFPYHKKLTEHPIQMNRLLPERHNLKKGTWARYWRMERREAEGKSVRTLELARANSFLS